MARIRTIKPDFWTNDRVMECSMNTRLMFIGMWNFADDLGRLPLSSKTIKAQIFPSDDISSDTILGMIEELSENGLILTYEVDGRRYIQIVGWQHQRIDKPQPGKCPGPANSYSKIIPGMLATEGKGKEGKGKEGSGEEKKSSLRSDSAPAKRGTRLPLDWNPSTQDLNEACRKLGGAEPASQELAKFRDHWKAAPGQRGVKLDWDATWRNWIRNAKGPTNGYRTANPRTTGHDAFLAVATRKAREMFGDGDMAGPAKAAEFPFGDGAFSGGPSGSGAPTCGPATGDNGRKPGSDGVLEGEIFPPDQAADGLPNGRRHH